MSTQRVLIILAHGFEELEAVAVIDILRRGKIDVVVAGLEYPVVTSARGIPIIADTQLCDVKTELFDAVILPGGEPGTTYLEVSALVKTIVMRHARHTKLIAAICAAPRILDSYGLLSQKQATGFPGVALPTCHYSENRVVVDGQIITSRGAGTAMAFGYAILSELGHPEIVKRLQDTMLFS